MVGSQTTWPQSAWPIASGAHRDVSLMRRARRRGDHGDSARGIGPLATSLTLVELAGPDNEVTWTSMP